MKFSKRDLQDLTDIIDERVERKLANRPRWTYGIVAGIAGNIASIKLMGNDAASGGFRVPPHFDVAVGELVRCVIDPSGDRWIEADLTANHAGAAAGDFSAGGSISADLDITAGRNISAGGVVSTPQLTVQYGGKIYFPDTAGNDPTSIETINEDPGTRVLRMRVGDDAGDAVDMGYYYYADQSWHSGMRVNVNGDVVIPGTLTLDGDRIYGQRIKWVPTAEFNVVAAGTTTTDKDNQHTPEITVVPTSGVIAITGRLYAKDTVAGGEVSARHFSNGAIAASAKCPIANDVGYGTMIVQPGGTNGRQISYDLRPNGTLTYYIQVSGYFTTNA